MGVEYPRDQLQGCSTSTVPRGLRAAEQAGKPHTVRGSCTLIDRNVPCNAVKLSGGYRSLSCQVKERLEGRSDRTMVIALSWLPGSAAGDDPENAFCTEIRAAEAPGARGVGVATRDLVHIEITASADLLHCGETM